MKKMILIILGISSISLAADSNFSLFSSYQGTYTKSNKSYINDYNIGTKLEFDNQYVKSNSKFQMEHLFNPSYNSNFSITTNNNFRYDIKDGWALIGLAALNNDTKTNYTSYNFGAGFSKMVNGVELSLSEINGGLNLDRLYSGISLGLGYKNDNVEIKDTALQFLYGGIFKNSDKTVPYQFIYAYTDNSQGIAPIYFTTSKNLSRDYAEYQNMLYDYIISPTNDKANNLNKFATEHHLTTIQNNNSSLSPTIASNKTIPYRVLLLNTTNLTFNKFTSKNRFLTQMDHIIQKIAIDNGGEFTYLDGSNKAQKAKDLLVKTHNFIFVLNANSDNEYKLKDYVTLKANLGLSFNNDLAYAKDYINGENVSSFSIYNNKKLDTNIAISPKFTLGSNVKYTIEPKLTFDYNYSSDVYQGSYNNIHTFTLTPSVNAGISVPIADQLTFNFNVNLAPSFVGKIKNSNVNNNSPANSDVASSTQKLSFSNFTHSEKLELKYTF